MVFQYAKEMHVVGLSSNVTLLSGHPLFQVNI